MSAAAFDARRDAFERAYALDEELAFKARARASHAFGLWAASCLHYRDDMAETYAAALRATQVATGSMDEVFDRVRADFAASGLPHSATWLRRRLEYTMAQSEETTRRDG